MQGSSEEPERFQTPQTGLRERGVGQTLMLAAVLPLLLACLCPEHSGGAVMPSEVKYIFALIANMMLNTSLHC